MRGDMSCRRAPAARCRTEPAPTLETALYVLHAFQKKSKTPAATPKKEIELIKKRLRDAETIERARNEQER